MQPEQLGPYKIGRIIGKGGMGAVYEGLHTETKETAAVKVLLGNLEDDTELRLRFEAEIETLKRLKHPNIVQLFGFGEEQGMLYYVMELVHGPSLQQEIKRQRSFQWYEVAKIGLEICFALKHAHDRGIIHRDIKPANILLEQDGSIKLSDYGIAHFFGGQRLTDVNSIVGTLEYMSPEQATAGPIGPRSDIYSLGAVLHTLLVGHPPFSAKSLPEILRKHQKNTFASIRTIRYDVPDELETILIDLLKIHPEERPNNAYLAAKRFQSLLQALMGPPEKILVKPMSPDSPKAVPQESLHIPYKGDGKIEEIAYPCEFAAEGVLVDLDGVVGVVRSHLTERHSSSVVTDVYIENPDSSGEEVYDLKAEPSPSEKTSLAASFGKPGNRVAENSKSTEVFSGSPLAGQETPTLCQAAGLSDELPQQDAMPPDSGLSPAAKEPENRSPDLPSKLLPPLFDSDVRYGEVIIGDSPEVKRGKDEPLPDISVFESLKPKQKTEDFQEEKQAQNDKSTLNGFGTGYKPLPHLISNPPGEQTAEFEKNKIVSPEKKPEHRPLAGVYEVQNPVLSASASGAVNIKEQGSANLGSSSHFVSVKGKTFDDYSDSSRSNRPWISIQTVCASISLILIGILFYYILQPVPAERQFERIRQTISGNGEDTELSLPVLRKAGNDIKRFLAEYPQHPLAEQVRFYQDELNLAELERRLERRQTLDEFQTNIAERAYLDALSHIKSDPEKTVIKLKALIALFSDENQNLRTTKQCVELAKRRLEKLEEETRSLYSDQLNILRDRLKEAERLDKVFQPERAAGIRRGIIELYQDKLWAKEAVEEARKGLRLAKK